MRLHNQRYSFVTVTTQCPNCNEMITDTAPDIDGLLHFIECTKCGYESPFTLLSTNDKIRRSDTLTMYNAIIEETHGKQMTVRHLFYRLVGKKVIDKTEAAYDSMCRHTGIMRKTGLLNYEAFVDSTRWQRKQESYTNLSECLESTARFYRQNLWANSDTYVEIWSEKDAISNILYPVTNEYDIPLMVARGFSSITFLYDSARHIESLGKPAYIYHIGDRDPSGLEAADTIEESFEKFGVDITFIRLAVTTEQIQSYNLPTRPTKKGTHKKGFVGDSVEVDAMEPETIQAILRQAIEQHIDKEELKRLKGIEQAERQTLYNMAKLG